ncbi:hypothetical protein ACRAWD_24560 [Caulobacter segnis]
MSKTIKEERHGLCRWFPGAGPEGQAGRLQGKWPGSALRSGWSTGALSYVECVADDVPYGQLTCSRAPCRPPRTRR